MAMAMDEREFGNLIGSDKVEGTAVYGADSTKIGSIERVMIDKQSGKVEEVGSDYFIGADGAASVFRQKLASAGVLEAETISFAGGYKEFLLPSAKNGAWILPPRAYATSIFAAPWPWHAPGWRQLRRRWSARRARACWDRKCGWKNFPRRWTRSHR